MRVLPIRSPARARRQVGLTGAVSLFRCATSAFATCGRWSAAAALPLFYSGVWPMAVALHPARLALICDLAITAMVMWFVC